MKKKRVALLFGGRSAEHEVSLQSAKNVYEALPKDKYDVVLIGIDKSGGWKLRDAESYLLNAENPELIALNESNREVAVLPGSDREVVEYGENPEGLGDIDVVFPILHGPYGEDGTVQGMFKLLGIPCVGAGVLGSAVGMDKDVMKRLSRDGNIPVADFVVIREADRVTYEEIKARLGLPFFVKPANLGSSVGVSKVKGKRDFESAISEAFKYDTKVIVEEYIEGREIECSVLGNEKPIASVPGEIVLHDEFYSYATKYIDENGAELAIPADLSDREKKTVQDMAIASFKILECSGMARVDFFLTKDGKLYLNEINTIPGFTKISMYPKLWEASGLSYSELCEKLIELAIEKHSGEMKLKTNR